MQLGRSGKDKETRSTMWEMLFRGSDVILSIVRIGRGHLLSEVAVSVAVSLKS